MQKPTGGTSQAGDDPTQSRGTPAAAPRSMSESVSLVRGARGPRNICFRLMLRQYFGKASALAVAGLPRGMIESQKSVDGIASTRSSKVVKAILFFKECIEKSEAVIVSAATSDSKSADANPFKTSFRLFGDIIEKIRSLGTEMFEPGPRARNKGSLMKEFVQHGGPSTVCRLIMTFSEHNKSGTVGLGGKKGPRFHSGMSTLLSECCGFLRELVYEFPHLTQTSLVGDSRFIVHVLRHLLGISTGPHACSLIEEVLAFRKESFCLGEVPGIGKLLLSLSNQELALFCRTLALLIFEPETRPKPQNASGEGANEEGPVPSAPSSAMSVEGAASGDSLEELDGQSIVATLSSKSSPSTQSVFSSAQPYESKKSPPLRKTMKLVCPVPMTRRATLNVIDRNHALLVSTPGFIVRLVELLEVAAGKLDTSQGNGLEQLMGGNMNRQLSRMMHLMVQAHAAAAASGDREATEAFDLQVRMHAQEAVAEAMGVAPTDIDQALGVLGMGGDSSMRSAIDAMPLRPEYKSKISLSQMSVMQHLVELLFSIAILCSGKRKVEVQDLLAECGIVDTLSRLFDCIDWTPGHRQKQGPHGPGCQCNPRSAPKIQFLRLVHNFCDRQTYDNRHRHAILSSRDHCRIGRLREILDTLPIFKDSLESSRDGTIEKTAMTGNELASAIDSMFQIPNLESHYAREKLALLPKIMSVLCDASGDSPIKFWLAACIESFVRTGGPEAQVFVALANNGTLLDVIIDEICRGEGTGCGGLQTNFDMLGELIKFNPIILRILDARLSQKSLSKDPTTKRTFEQFTQIVRLHLVDSNVLLRAILLAIEVERQAGIMDAPTRFHNYIEEHKLPLLADMCTIVAASDVSQENLCCLNSTLVFLALARRRGCATDIIKRLRQRGSERGKTGFVTSSFRRLLWFWAQYYHTRAGDRGSLESSSKMKFVEFAEIADMLTADDGSEMALLERGTHQYEEFAAWRSSCWSAIQDKLDRQTPVVHERPHPL